MHRLLNCGIFSLALCLASGPVLAHPHVFIDTRITAILNDSGQLAAIRLRWDYDDYTSMLLVQDKGADPDGDGEISGSEMTALEGFDMTWIEGFDGDTTLAQDEVPLPLEPGPQDWVTGWSDGHLWSEHTRRLVSPVDPGAGSVVVQVYDITDYTAYSFAGAELDLAHPVGCQIAPPTDSDDDGAGVFSTLGLFVFGSDTADAAPNPMAPRAAVAKVAAGRAVAVLSCGG